MLIFPNFGGLNLLGWPKSWFGFFCKMALVAIVFNLIWNRFVLNCDSCHINVHLKTMLHGRIDQLKLTVIKSRH